MNQRVTEETNRILAEYEPEPLDEKIRAQMMEIVEEAEKRHSD